MAGFAALVDLLPSSDKQSTERLTRIREKARKENWPPLVTESEEYCVALDWEAIGRHLYGKSGWTTDDLQQHSPEALIVTNARRHR